MCLTASLGHRQDCLASTGDSEAWSTCSDSLTSLLKTDSTIMASADWQQVSRWGCCLLFCPWAHSRSPYLHSCVFCLEILLFILISLFIYTAAGSPITTSSCTVIYSPINIPPLVRLWDQGGCSSCSSSRSPALASGEHIKNVQRKHHTVQQRRARLPPPSWKLWLDLKALIFFESAPVITISPLRAMN